MLEPFNLFWMEREIYEEEDVNWWDGNGEVKEEEKGAIPKPSLFFTSDADFILTMAHRLNDTVEHRVFISDRQDREIVDFLELKGNFDDKWRIGMKEIKEKLELTLKNREINHYFRKSMKKLDVIVMDKVCIEWATSLLSSNVEHVDIPPKCFRRNEYLVLTVDFMMCLLAASYQPANLFAAVRFLCKYCPPALAPLTQFSSDHNILPFQALISYMKWIETGMKDKEYEKLHKLIGPSTSRVLKELDDVVMEVFDTMYGPEDIRTSMLKAFKLAGKFLIRNRICLDDEVEKAVAEIDRHIGMILSNEKILDENLMGGNEDLFNKKSPKKRERLFQAVLDRFSSCELPKIRNQPEEIAEMLQTEEQRAGMITPKKSKKKPIDPLKTLTPIKVRHKAVRKLWRDYQVSLWPVDKEIEKPSEKEAGIEPPEKGRTGVPLEKGKSEVLLEEHKSRALSVEEKGDVPSEKDNGKLPSENDKAKVPPVQEIEFDPHAARKICFTPRKNIRKDPPPKLDLTTPVRYVSPRSSRSPSPADTAESDSPPQRAVLGPPIPLVILSPSEYPKSPTLHEIMMMSPKSTSPRKGSKRARERDRERALRLGPPPKLDLSSPDKTSPRNGSPSEESSAARLRSKTPEQGYNTPRRNSRTDRPPRLDLSSPKTPEDRSLQDSSGARSRSNSPGKKLPTTPPGKMPKSPPPRLDQTKSPRSQSHLPSRNKTTENRKKNAPPDDKENKLTTSAPVRSAPVSKIARSLSFRDTPAPKTSVSRKRANTFSKAGAAQETMPPTKTTKVVDKQGQTAAKATAQKGVRGKNEKTAKSDSSQSSITFFFSKKI